MNKKVSIVTPAYNSAQWLEKCILSVKEQSYNNIEHLIIDGNSTDNTKEILKKYENTYNLKWVSEKDRGITDAMNKGFRLATGEIFAWIDADNYYNKDIIQEVIKIFDEKKDVDIVYGNIDFVNQNGVISKNYKPPESIDYKKALIKSTGSIPAQPGVFFKRELFEKVHGFDLNYRIAGDYDFWLNVLKESPKLLYLNITFGSYLIDDRGASQSLKGVLNGYKEMSKICSKNNQPFVGKIILLIKYLKGYVHSIIK